MAGQTRVLYAVEFDLDGNFDAAQINAAQFAGLQVVAVFEAGGRYRLLTGWKDEEVYTTNEAAFCKQVGLPGKPAMPAWRGRQHDRGRDPARRRLFQDSLLRLREWWGQRDSVPYVAEFAIQPRFDLATVKPADWKGLLYAQVLVGEKECRLLTFWTDQRDFAVIKEVFPARLGLTGDAAQPAWAGFHRDAKRPSTPHWRASLTTIWAAVATLFVVLGYFDKLRDAFAWMVVPPKAVIAEATRPADVLIGEEFEVPFEVHNVRSLGTCNVHFDAPRFEPLEGSPANGLELAHPVADYPSLKSGDKQVVKVSGKAVKAGDYRITLTGVSRSGFLFPAAPLTSEQTVNVWLPWRVGERRLAKLDKHYCVAEVDLWVGRTFPGGLEALARLARLPGVRFQVVISPRVSRADPAQEFGRKGAEVAMLRWWFGSLEGLKRVPFSLELGSDDERTPENWRQVIQQIDFDFQEARPEKR
jgi:hypothetical protein